MVYFNLIINKMGCATVKEKLESKIMLLKLQKVDILQEREEKLKEYQKITGETLHRKPVPDYVIKDESEVNNIKIKFIILPRFLPNNFFILGMDDFDRLRDFVDSDYDETNWVLYKEEYSLEGWLNRFIDEK